MFKKISSFLAAAATALSMNTATADGLWRSDRRFVVSTGINEKPLAPAFNFEYHDGFEHEMYFGDEFYMYGDIKFDFNAHFTKKLFMFNPELHYKLKAFERIETRKSGLEEKITKYIFHAGSAGGGFAFGEQLKRGARYLFTDSLLYIGPEASLTVTHETKGKADMNYFRTTLGTYSAFFISDFKSPVFMLSLKVEEEKRINKRWGLGLASDSAITIPRKENSFNFLQTLDIYTKIKTERKIPYLSSLPDKYSFGLRYLYFDGEDTRHTIMLFGMMEM